MTVSKPYRTRMQDDGSCRYEFRDSDSIHDGLYYPRGSVCWPMLNEATGTAEGFIICAALSIQTGSVIVFESTPFRTVEHVIDERGRIDIEGLASWFPAVWSHYNCINFFRSGNDETHRQYLLQVLRCDQIKPAPHFPEVFLCDAGDAQNVLFSWTERRKIFMDDTSRLHDDLIQWENTGRKWPLASVQAMLTLVNGYERYPFRKQQEEE